MVSTASMNLHSLNLKAGDRFRLAAMKIDCD